MKRSSWHYGTKLALDVHEGSSTNRRAGHEPRLAPDQLQICRAPRWKGIHHGVGV